MREIEFRGKARMSVEELNDIGLSHSNGWVYGNLIQSGGQTFIVGGVADWCDEYIAHEWWVLVDSDTVGQYTGLKDKHDTKIFEGDIVQIKDHPTNKYIRIDGNHEVYYDKDMVLCGGGWLLYRQLPFVTVVGNKFENPELLNN
ncbi:YopX family protein [Shouchella tritolerans]|uniref:YopX family protein n=1 Tax=Shouchella tritolerans TaxID=2979466 RepID=UPI0021E7B938|nr:YopX family protein [Shouchella tritolerans]